MSNNLPPLSSLTRFSEADMDVADVTLPHLKTWSARPKPRAGFSSPPPFSSSPPATPSSHYAHSYAYIQSSPIIGNGLDLPPLRYHSGEQSYWRQQDAPFSVSFQSTSSKHIHRHRFALLDEHDYPPTSEADFDYAVEDAEMSLPEIDSETTSESTPGHDSAYFSDTDEEQENADDGMGLAFRSSPLRATSFQVSAERGRWKDDPMASKPRPAFQVRRSAPTLSRPPSPSPPIAQRPLSEPLPHPDDNEPLRAASIQIDAADAELSRVPMQGPLDQPSDQEVGEPSTVDTVDDIATHEFDIWYSSPLPPSSPPLSPMSECISSPSRSVSPVPFSLAPSTLTPSSPVPALRSGSYLAEEALNDVVADISDRLPAGSPQAVIEHDADEVNVVY